MRQPKPQARKSIRLLRWLSAGRGNTRSNSQIVNANRAAIFTGQCQQPPDRQPCPRRPTRCVASLARRRGSRRTQIPIVQAVPLTFSHRGFFH